MRSTKHPSEPQGSAPPMLGQLLRRSAAAQVGLAFVAILVLKWGVLTQPPVWDTAMGVFPAALTLASNGFDLIALLGMPTYADSGPNTHSLSAVTLATALVLMVTGGGTKAFVLLHLAHFVMAAIGLAALFRFARPVVGETVSALLCVSLLLYPLFLVQVGYLYLELPLFLCAVCALLAWVEGRFWPAVLWAALAFAVKEVGIIVPATLATAALLENRSLQARAARIVKIASVPILWWTFRAVLSALAGFEGAPRPDYPLIIVYVTLAHYWERFIFRVPDLVALTLTFVVGALVYAPGLVKKLRRAPREPTERGPEDVATLTLTLSCIICVGFLILFFLVLPVTSSWVITLPRYFVIITPFLLLWVGHVAESLGDRLWGRGSLAVALTFLVLSSFFVLNRSGRFYPLDIDTQGPGNDWALTERSHAYQRLHSIQREALEYLSTLPDSLPVYYGHYEHYLLTYPGLGHTEGPLPNGHNLSQEAIPEMDPIATGCWYVLFNYPVLGGDKMLQWFEQVDESPRLSREVVREFRDGRYVITLSRIASEDVACVV